MRILILGGTQFIGRQIVETLLGAGHSVTILTRGKTTDELPIDVERLRGDRDQGAPGLKALNHRLWDACVDLSGYTPRQVRASAQALLGSVGRYVFVSSCSVYGDPKTRPVLESHPRLPPADERVVEIDADTYGPLKVACENIVQQLYNPCCTILRPQQVVGEHDPNGRYAYWLQRSMRGGEMMAPGDGSDHLQVIDVCDVARFAKTIVENNIGGVFNLAGPRITWAEFVSILGVADYAWVSAEIINSAGVTWAELPMYRHEHGPDSGRMHVSNLKAYAAGFTATSPATTAGRIREFFVGKTFNPVFSQERESELIAISRNMNRSHI